ncbi:MAG: transcriptional regulator [Pseudonocardiales bacterium]|nr:transcriptional regulator [Pseudonocardiales bacterium]
MKHTSAFILDDAEEVKRLIRENPWATLISNTSTGLVASHCPVILEENASAVSVLSHLGRPDEELHELGQHEVMLIVQGPHGYISPGWYVGEPAIPTWNHVTAHLYGTPELLDDEQNWEALGALVDHFENVMPIPARMEDSRDYAQQIYRRTAGFRLQVTRFEARLKLSQNKSPASVARVIDELESGAHYKNPSLAAEMRRVHTPSSGDAAS